MEDMQSNEILAIDEDFASPITMDEALTLKPIHKKVMASYLEHRDSMPIDEWLRAEMAESLPDRSAEEISQMSDEIITTLNNQKEKKISLEKAISCGRSKESWFADEAKKAMSHMSTQESVKYLQHLDDALSTANDALYRTTLTKAGLVSKSANLDGYIAEQYHAQTFNLNAEATGSPYRAKVLEPANGVYGKNSVDIVIVDGNGKVVRRYQSKYYKDANATLKAFERGDYRGQQKLVPDGQKLDTAKKYTNVITAPDGTASNPLSKDRATRMKTEAQSGKWNDLNWNEYKAKDLAIGVGKQAAHSALMGVTVGVGVDIAQKIWNGEEIDGGELIESAVTVGADYGIKAATAGALKIGVEKNVIKAIPKSTPVGTIANIANVAIENVKIIGKMANGDLTVKEGFEKMEQTTVATVAGVAASTEGAAIGSTIGTIFGPVGTAVGGLLGGAVGYMMGSKVGETVTKGAQKIRSKVTEVVKSIGHSVGNVVSSVASGVSSLCRGVLSIFGW